MKCWCTAIFKALQRDSATFKSWLLLCHSRIFYRVVLHPLLVLLEAQPTPSLRSRALWRWLSSSCLWIHLSSTLTSLPVSVVKVYPHTVMLPPPGFIVGIAPSRWCPFFSRHDLWDSGQEFSLCLIRELCSWSESPSGGFGQTPDGLSCAFYPGVSLLRPFCPDQSASCGKSPCGSKFFHLLMMGKTSLIKTFSAVEVFLYTHPELSLTAVYRQLRGLDGACQSTNQALSFWTSQRRVYALPNHIHSAEFTTGGPQSHSKAAETGHSCLTLTFMANKYLSTCDSLEFLILHTFARISSRLSSLGHFGPLCAEAFSGTSSVCVQQCCVRLSPAGSQNAAH